MIGVRRENDVRRNSITTVIPARVLAGIQWLTVPRSETKSKDAGFPPKPRGNDGGKNAREAAVIPAKAGMTRGKNTGEKKLSGER
jgi:hypothetical protein